MAVAEDTTAPVAAPTGAVAKTPTAPLISKAKTKLHMFTTTVKEGKMDLYIDYHNNIFPEVAKGLREHGIVRLEINKLGETNKLMMVIETAPDLDLGKATGPGSDYMKDPKCVEWEELMKSYFEGETWHELTQIHSSEVHWGKH